MWGFNFGVSNHDWNEMNNSMHFLSYLLMNAEQLQSEREALQSTVNDQIAREQADQEEVRVDNESAMLRGHEAAESLRIFDALKQKYASTLQEKGGVDEVIKELEDFIVGKLGDELCRTDVERRKYNKKDSLEVQQQKAALRAILDNAPSPPSHFGNFLHPEATERIGPSWGAGAPNGRETLAYFWLAASDPDMPLAPEDEQAREQCVRDEKMMVIAGLSDIRRAHNDGSYSPVDAVLDDPSCAPGTWGRIAKMHVHNTLTQMQAPSLRESHAPKFKNHIEPFVIAQFKSKSLQQQLQMINALNNEFVNGEKLNEGMPFPTFEQFIDDMNHSHALRREFVEIIADNYGNTSEMMYGKYLDMNHLKLAHITFTEEMVKMKQAPTLDLVARLQSIAIHNLFSPAIAETKQELASLPEVKKARDSLVKIVQSQKAILQSLKVVSDKIQKLDATSEDFSAQLEALKKEKHVLSTRFSVLMANKSKQEKVIEDVAKREIVLKVKSLIHKNMMVSTKQVDNLIAELLPQEQMKSAVLQVVQQAAVTPSIDDSVDVSPELKGITLDMLKKHHTYKMFAQTYQAQKKSPEEVEKLTNARVLKAILQMNNPDIDADRLVELVEEWQTANPYVVPLTASSSPSQPTVVSINDAVDHVIDKLPLSKQIHYAQRLAGVPVSANPGHSYEKLSDEEVPKVVDFDKALKRLNNIINTLQPDPQNNLLEQAIRARTQIGNYYYQLAGVLGTDNAKAYNDCLAKAQACGVDCELGFDPKVVKTQGIDQAVVNPNWLMGIRANFEDIEEAFKLNSAAVSKVVSDLRYDKLLKSFGEFALRNASDVRVAEAALEIAADSYFMELDKDPPNQVVLQQKFQALQSSRQSMLLEIDDQIAQFKQFYLTENPQYYETDSVYLRKLLMDTDLIEQKLDPALHSLYTGISNRMKQVSRIEPLYTAHDRAIAKAKKDCLDLVESFATKVADKVQVLENRNPKKNSLAGKQLRAFKVAQSALANLERSNLARDPASNSIKLFQDLGSNSIAVATQLEANLNRIGQANKFKRAIRSFRNAIRSVFRRIGMNVDQVVAKELSRAEIASVKIDAENVNAIAQNNTIQSKKQKIKQHDNNRSKAVLSSYAKDYRKVESDARLLSENEVALALRYIQSNIDNPFKLNLTEQFYEGVNVTIASDLHVNPIALRFENPMSQEPPKLIKMEAQVLKQFAKNQMDREQQQQLSNAQLNDLAILFSPYDSFGQVGTSEGRPQRWAFVQELDKMILHNENDLVEVVLKAQTTKGLQALLQTLANNAKFSNLQTAVTAICATKETNYFIAVEDARKGRHPLPIRDEWEKATANESREALKVLIRSQTIADDKDNNRMTR